MIDMKIYESDVYRYNHQYDVLGQRVLLKFDETRI